MKNRFLSVIFALLAAGCAHRLVPPLDYASAPRPVEEPFRAQPPPLARVVDAPDSLRETTLRNGLHVLLVERHGFPAVTARLLVDRGALDLGDAGGQETSQMLYLFGRAGGQQAFEEVQEECARRGTSWFLSNDDDSVVAGVSAPSSAFSSALSVLARVTFGAKLSRDEYEQHLRDLKQRRSVDGVSAGERAVLFGAVHGYGNDPTLRPPRSFDEVTALHDRLFQPQHATLIVVGDVTPAEIDAAVERSLGAWAGAQAIPRKTEAPPFLGGGRIAVVTRRGYAQRHAAVFARGPLFASDDAAAFEVAAQILGGAQSSGLSEQLRENSRATYGVTAPVHFLRTASWLSIAASYDSSKAVRSVAGVLEAIEGLRQGNVADDDIALARSTVVADMRMNMVTLAGAAALYTRWVARGIDPSRLAAYPDRVEQVGRDDLIRIARTYLAPGALHVVFVGADAPPDMRSLGLGDPTTIKLWK